MDKDFCDIFDLLYRLGISANYTGFFSNGLCGRSVSGGTGAAITGYKKGISGSGQTVWNQLQRRGAKHPDGLWHRLGE